MSQSVDGGQIAVQTRQSGLCSRMAHFTFRPLAYVFLAMASACGGTTSSLNSSAPVTEADFPASYTQAICDLASKCCTSSFDITACRASVVPPGASPYQRYDATNGSACIAALRNYASSCAAPAREYATVCRTLYVGIQAIGDPCTEPSDCIGDATGESYCSFSTPQTCQVTLKLGESCSVLDPSTGVYVPAQCGAGLYCSTSGVCAPKVNLGQPCEQPYSADNCVAPLRCYPAGGMTCASLAPDGASCIGGSDCTDGYCSNGTCQATLAIATSRICNSSGSP